MRSRGRLYGEKGTRVFSISIERGLQLTRVLFLAAPFKSQFIENMAEFFSRDISWKMMVSEDASNRHRRRCLKEKISDRVHGIEKLAEVVREFRPDVIYTDNLSYSSQVKIVTYLAHIRIPHILHLRGDWWNEYLAWYRLASSRDRLWGSPFYPYYWFGIASATLVTPICRWLENRVKHHLPWKRTNVV
ncbi:MAG: hypothetical protein V1857_04620, partial [archaeon]